MNVFKSLKGHPLSSGGVQGPPLAFLSPTILLVAAQKPKAYKEKTFEKILIYIKQN